MLNQDSELISNFKKSGFFKKVGTIIPSIYWNYLLTAEITKMLPNNMFRYDNQYFIFGNTLETLAHSIDAKVTANLKLESKNQYLGPLRYVPKRKDFNKVRSKSEGHEKKQSKHTFSSLFVYLNTLAFLPKSLQDSQLKYLQYLFNFSLIIKTMWNNNLRLRDVRNFFRRNINKLSSGISMNSEQMWSAFIECSASQQQISAWLSDETKLKTPYSIRVDKKEKADIWTKIFGIKPEITDRLVFVDKRTDTEVTPQEMGLGISQVLPVLIASMAMEKHKIFIEQPELHLHPAVQCELADEFIKSMNTKNNEFVLESHSEHLLLRIMRRMRQTAEGTLAADDELALTPDDVCLLYVDNNGQFTHINELELDDDGSLLDPWPNGFFEEGYKERFA